VPPGTPIYPLVAGPNGIPVRSAEVAMGRAVRARFECLVGNIVQQELTDGIVAGLVEQDHVLAVNDPN
jgi:hypothetical protein